MRAGFSLFFVCAVAIANASFELVLVTDFTGNTSAVRRFDGVSGISLGSFGEGILIQPTGIVLDQANNLAYVNDAPTISLGRVSKWNYNTGEFLGSFTYVRSGATSFGRNPDGTLNLVGPTTANRINTSGVVLATYNAPANTSFSDALQASDGTMFLMGQNSGGSGRLNSYNYTTGTLLGTNSWFADHAMRLSGAFVANGYVFSGATTLERDSWSGSSVTSFSFTQLALSSVNGIAAGHNNIGYVLGGFGTGSLIQRVDLNNTLFVAGSTFGTGLTNAKGIAVVVAPEPISLTMLLPGLIVVMRRRRNR